MNFARWSPDGVPWIATPPTIATCIHVGDTAVVSVVPATADDFSGPMTYSWVHNGITTVVDGPGGTTRGGGTVFGSATATITIFGTTTADLGTYTVTVASTCGSVLSKAGALSVSCAADFNRSCTLEVQDIFDFLAAWFAGCPPLPATCPADFNGRDGLTVQDIFDYLAAWFTGC